MALHTIPAMRSRHIPKLRIHVPHLGRMRNSQPWTLGTQGAAILRQQRLPIFRTRHRRKLSCTTHLRGNRHTTRLWPHPPLMVVTSLRTTRIMCRRRCRRRPSAQCQHLHSSTRGQHQFRAMESRGIQHQPMMVDMATLWNHKDGQNMGALLRSITHNERGT